MEDQNFEKEIFADRRSQKPERWRGRARERRQVNPRERARVTLRVSLRVIQQATLLVSLRVIPQEKQREIQQETRQVTLVGSSSRRGRALER